MGNARKKPRTFAERQAFYAEQARANRETGGGAKATRGTDSRSRRARPGRRPGSSSAYPCRVYFWQQVEGEPIRIGHAVEGNDQGLKVMRGTGAGRAHRLAVVPDANTEREAVIRQRFAHLKVEAGTSFYRPESELLQFIAAHAIEWEPPVKVPPPPRRGPEPGPEPKRPKAVVQGRTCERCGVEFGSKEKDRYCNECRKELRKRWQEEGYLEKVPWRNPYASRSDYGRGDDPDFENAARSMEGD